MTPTCPLCPPDSLPPTERIVWQHEPRDCWCESSPANDRRHVSYACLAHVDRETATLRDLGYVVLGLSDVTA